MAHKLYDANATAGIYRIAEDAADPAVPGSNAGNPNTPTAGGNQGDPRFTQADVDRILAERLPRAENSAQKAILSELGIENLDSLKNIVQAARDAEAANLSQVQRLEQELETLKPFKTRATELEQVNASLTSALDAQLTALKADLQIPAYLDTLLGSMSTDQQLTYLAENRAEFTKRQPPNTNGADKGGSPGLSQEQIEQRKREIAQKHGIAYYGPSSPAK